MSDTVREILEARRRSTFTWPCGTSRWNGGGGDVRMTATVGGSPVTVDGSHLLLAVGRLPNTGDLNLDSRRCADRCARLYPRSMTSCGPAPTGSGPWVTSMAEAPSPTPPTTISRSSPPICSTTTSAGCRDRITAYALFTDPPLGRVGMTEAEVRASGRPALKGVLPMTRVGRAKERGETLGFMKVLVDRETHLILGAALLCVEGDEIVHSLLDIMAGQGALHRDPARRPHPPDGQRVDPDAAGEFEAAGIAGPDQLMPSRGGHLPASSPQSSFNRASRPQR